MDRYVYIGMSAMKELTLQETNLLSTRGIFCERCTDMSWFSLMRACLIDPIEIDTIVSIMSSIMDHSPEGAGYDGAFLERNDYSSSAYSVLRNIALAFTEDAMCEMGIVIPCVMRIALMDYNADGVAFSIKELLMEPMEGCVYEGTRRKEVAN